VPESPDPDLIRTSPDVIDPASDGLLVRSRPATGPWPLVGIVLAIVALLGGGYLLLQNRAEPARPPADAATEVSPVTVPVQPLGGNPFPADVPALDLSDGFVRQWVPRLSSHPSVAAWLATDGLIRNFVTVVSNIADGATPAGRVPTLRPAGTFQVLERGELLVIDPRSYARYDALAAAMASLDAAGSAQLYATLKPRIEEAHAELGAPPGSFDRTLERALVTLIQTPVPDQAIAVEPSGIGYRFAEDGLEGLTGAQRHLLRMGPANARLVQRALRDLALALGIPASRLPAPPVS
jgi:hypothetical protein